MQISQVIKTEEGTYTFEGELTQEELDLVMEVGLNTLMHNGSLPFATADNPAQFPLNFSDEEH